MVTKIAAKSLATSIIGAQLKLVGCARTASRRDEPATRGPRRRAAGRARSAPVPPPVPTRRARCRASTRRSSARASHDRRQQQEVDLPSMPKLGAAVRAWDPRQHALRRGSSSCRWRRRARAGRRSQKAYREDVAQSSRRSRRPSGSPGTAAGRPSGVSEPPMLATRKMKNTTTWATCLRLSLARMQRADQQHRGAGGARQAGQRGADGEQRRVQPGCRAGCRGRRCRRPP